VALLASEKNTQQIGFQLAGGIPFNPDRYGPDARFVFEALAETTDALDACEVRFFNVTTATVIMTLSTASLVSVVLSQTLTSPADLAAGQNIYNVLFRLATTGAPNAATVTGAQLRVVYATAW
jgi:hypothetical protein